MAIKNERELEGLRNAYIRDAVAFVRPLMALCFLLGLSHYIGSISCLA